MGEESSERNVKQGGVHTDPSIPQSLPGWQATARAGPETVRAYIDTAEHANRSFVWKMLIQESRDLNTFSRNNTGGKHIGGKTRQISQSEQTHANGRYDGQEMFQHSDCAHTQSSSRELPVSIV
jgi:hypothetical protein